MTQPRMTRGEFLRDGSWVAAGAMLGGIFAPECAHCGETGHGDAAPTAAGAEPGASCPAISLRPSELLCAVCSLGESDAGPEGERLKELLATVRQTPDAPITLHCNVGDVFAYQDPGPEADAPGSPEFERRKDLDVLLRLNLPPGTTLPARILFHRLLDRIATVAGICGCDTATSDAWQGCPKARSGRYEKARERGIEAIIPPRSEAEMEQAKKASLAAMLRAEAIPVRPHILVCSVCQYGGGVRPPFKADNLPDLLQLMFRKPDTQITMARGADWMMCAPCPNWAPRTSACVNVQGSGGLTNQLRDLRTLQRLGLTYGATMNARELFRRILERIPNTMDICRLDSPTPSVWWDPCGARETNNPDYEKGRQMLMEKLA